MTDLEIPMYTHVTVWTQARTQLLSEVFYKGAVDAQSLRKEFATEDKDYVGVTILPVTQLEDSDIVWDEVVRYADNRK